MDFKFAFSIDLLIISFFVLTPTSFAYSPTLFGFSFANFTLSFTLFKKLFTNSLFSFAKSDFTIIVAWGYPNFELVIFLYSSFKFLIKFIFSFLLINALNAGSGTIAVSTFPVAIIGTSSFAELTYVKSIFFSLIPLSFNLNLIISFFLEYTRIFSTF